MSGKWYVVGKVCGVVATVKTLALLGIGFIGGCMLMDDRGKRHTRRYGAGDPVYDQGWSNGYHTGRTSANEENKRENNAYNEGFNTGFNFAKDSYGYEFEMSRAEPRPESEDEDAEE